jgi:hypothetical protein
MFNSFTPDAVALVAAHGILTGVLVLSLGLEVRIRFKRRHSSLKGELRRGAEGQGTILTLYGLATVALTFAVDVADTAHGWKALIVLADYIALTHLFFFNGWFKNRIFGALQRSSVEYI